LNENIFEVNHGSTPSFYIKEGGGGQPLMRLDTYLILAKEMTLSGGTWMVGL